MDKQIINEVNNVLAPIENGGNVVLYEYIRGSHAYGLNTPTSDIDYGTIFVSPMDNLLGLTENRVLEITDDKHDSTAYELEKFGNLLLKSNPNIIEALFIDEKFILQCHPLFRKYFLNNRDKFLSKDFIKSLIGYAYAQIHRARSLGKKMLNPVGKREGILDFCYVPNKQGSISMIEWLNKYKLNQKFCGLVAIPHMQSVYGVYYDWKSHLEFNDTPTNKREFVAAGTELGAWPEPLNPNFVIDNLKNREYLNYKGIIKDGNKESTDVRLSSIINKQDQPICVMSFNKDGYTKHCKDYKEYTEWEKNRNPIRYESNLEKNYDSKNLLHTVRLIHVALEVAQGKGFNTYRTEDRDFLLKIKGHEFSYDFLVDYATKKKGEVESALETCTLPNMVDPDIVNEILVHARKELYNVK